MSCKIILLAIIVGIFQSMASTFIVFRLVKAGTIKNRIIFYLITFLYYVFVFLFIPNQIRFFLFLIVMSLLLFFVLGVKDKKVLLYSLEILCIMSISEIIVSILLVLFGINSSNIVKNPMYNLLANVLIALFAILIINVPAIKGLINRITKLFIKNPKLNYYLLCFSIILYLIVAKNGLEFVLKSSYYINVLFLICMFFIITIIIRKELKEEQLKETNQQMLNYVTKYEKIITEQGKANHEFKNQLMVIRGYAQMNSPKLMEYLNSIVEDSKKAGSSYLISQLNNFPDGGIKGLLYYKLSVMEDDKIKYEINVQSGVKTKLDSLSTNMYKNITKILGVFLDNAIDASKQTRHKRIIISVTKEKSDIIFSIYNTYKGKIDISKIGTGHTTKGSGHGYGLKLVKDIVDNNKSLSMEKALEDEFYVSRLSIKVSNKRKK